MSGPLSVVVTMKTPWVAFPLYLTGTNGVVALPSTLGGRAKNNPVGTGPFVFQRWVPGDHFAASRNPHYWRPGLPYLDQITYKPIVDAVSRENSLRSGTIDMMHSSDTQNLLDLQGDSSFVVIDDRHSTFEPSMNFVMLNTAVSPMDDLRVRQALAYAIDKRKVVDTVFNGLPPESFGPFVHGSPYFAPTGYPDFNLAKAQTLVRQYQAEKGPISFEYAAVNSPKYVLTNQLVQAMWKAAGIQSQIVQVEQSSSILNTLGGKYQAYTWRQFDAPDPDGNYPWWSTTTAAPAGQLSLNLARNKDAQIQAALDTGRSSPDPATRAAAYQGVARRLGADLPYLWLSRTIWMVAATPRVMNFNGPSLPDGVRGLGMIAGIVTPTQIWVNA